MKNLGCGSSQRFVCLATFDGSNNRRKNLDLSGSTYQKNVANIFDQAKQAETASFRAEQYPGVGTGGSNGNQFNSAIAPTAAIYAAAELALSDFADQALRYLRSTPGATLSDITASAVGFSRGSATSVLFARLLEERGLVTADGTVVAPPGTIKVSGLVLLDPVYSFIDAILSIPRNVIGPVLVVRALDENRDLFPPPIFEPTSLMY